MSKVTWNDRLRYQIDNAFSRGTLSMILWLGLLSLGTILVSAVLIIAFQIRPDGSETLEFGEAVWGSLMRALDSSMVSDDTGWAFRLLMLLVPTLGGIFILSTLIGVLSSAIEGKLTKLRKGRSRVIERDHTVIFGWTEQIFTIVTELVTANENQKDRCIVILGDKDKLEMEDEIRQKVGTHHNTRIVCRTGNPLEIGDLEIVSLDAARSIVVLSPESENPDSEVIKTILAIINQPERRTDPYHIVAELRDPKNSEIAAVVGKEEVEWIMVGGFIARIIAQTCRQSGLSTVYTELLDFGGYEIYFSTQPSLEGKNFGHALLCFERNTLIGLCKPGRSPELNPPMNTLIEPGDRLILIAEDDDLISVDGRQVCNENQMVFQPFQPPQPERTLVLGWNWRGPAIIWELDHYVAPGSDLMIVSCPVNIESQLEGIRRELKNQRLRCETGDATSRPLLEALKPEMFNHVIVLSCSDELAAQQADACTLITLLHLRDIAEQREAKFSIVSEMMDIRNRNLAEVTRADDFIVSDKLVSLMMAQVSENRHLNSVFADLFAPDGSEIYLKPAEDYVKLDTATNFYTITAAAREHGEVAIGYQLRSLMHNPHEAYGIKINPTKSELIQLDVGDRVIVLAEC